MNVLVVDVGGTNVKLLAGGQAVPRRFPSGKTLTPELMVASARDVARDWPYDVVAIGYPGVVHDGRPAEEPHNLAAGWVGFDFQTAFGCPVQVLNDAAMQALGGYRGGLLLFLGLGTGLGSALVAHGAVIPMELAHLPWRNGTYEDYLGTRGLQRLGKKKWRRRVAEAVARLRAALRPDDVVIGGGNAKKLKEPPPGCRLGSNADALQGGFRLWERRDGREGADPAGARLTVGAG